VKRLIIIIAVLFTTTAQADIDLKGYRLGMTFEQFQEHSKANKHQTLTRYLRLEQPFLDGTIGQEPLDSVFTTINLTPVILTAVFDEAGRIDYIVASDWNHRSSCIKSQVWAWVKRNDRRLTFGDKPCSLTRQDGKEVDHDTLMQSLKQKFKKIEITPDTLEKDNGEIRKFKRFAYVEKDVRLLGYSSETDHSFRITLMKQSKYLENKASNEKFKQKILNDI
jgi:hypothetical protein